MAIETGYNEMTQRAKVVAGFRGGNFFSKPILHPAMTFVDGVPAEVKEKMDFAKIPNIPVVDTWKSR
jgi:hypothetical protein